MPTQKPQSTPPIRKLAAILFTDMEGFTALMAKDEVLASRLRQRHRQVLHDCHQQYRGEVVNYFGDGTLSIFNSAVDAVQCAIEMQRAFQEDPQVPLRIGIHLGEVVRDREGLYGNSVNIASRLESFATAGSILVSTKIREELANQKDFSFRSLGLFELKNVPKPVEVFAVANDGIGIPKLMDLLGKGKRLDGQASSYTFRLENFVGREKELALLRKAWKETQAGKGTMIGIAGEPGIGKTTLVEDFLLEKEEGNESGIIARGRGSERLAGTEAYLPFLEILKNLIREEANAAMLRQLAPAWYVQLRPYSVEESKTLVLAAQATQERLKQEMSTFLEALANRRPLVLFVDDLHWADASSTDLLAYLAPRLPQISVLILTTYRPVDMNLVGHPFLSIKTDLKARRLFRETLLPYLEQEDIKQHLEMKYPNNEFPEDLALRIQKRTEGSPLFMVDLIQDLEENAVIAKANGSWKFQATDASLEKILPESIAAMVQRKIGQLPEEDFRILSMAAIQGYEFNALVVATALSLDELYVEDRCQILEKDYRLVHLEGERKFPDGSFSGHYRFVHALYQNALFDAVSPMRLSKWSKQVAEVLHTLYIKDASSIAFEIAKLYETARQFDLALEYYCLAAQKNSAISAYKEVMILVNKGLELLKKLPEQKEFRLQELKLLNMFSQALIVTKGYGVTQLEEIYDRVNNICLEIDEKERLFINLMGQMSYRSMEGKHDKVIKLGDQIEKLGRELNDSGYVIGGYFSRGVGYFLSGQFFPASEQLSYAVDQYNPNKHFAEKYLTIGVDVGLGAFCYAAWAYCLLGYPDKTEEIVLKGIKISRDLDHFHSHVYNINGYCFNYQFIRAPREVLELSGEVLDILQKQHSPFFNAFSRVFNGWALAHSGQVKEGTSIIEAGFKNFSSIAPISFNPYMLAMLAECYGLQERYSLALSTLQRAIDIYEYSEDRFYEAEIYRLQGQFLQRLKSPLNAVEDRFKLSIKVAQAQQAKWWELRATVSLASLWEQQGKHQEAHDQLKTIYDWFTEGFDTADMKEAKALLKKLHTQIQESKKAKEVVSPSIAVLPFTNMSSDPEQEYFCDGITEEILNALAQVQKVKVIARTSAFAFKGQNLDVREIARQLGVSFVLEGSVRKAGKRLRISTQLIKAGDGAHLWSQRFDREMNDIFEIQDEIANAVTEKLKIKFIEDNEAGPAKYSNEDLEAYHFYLKGRYFWYRWSGEEDFRQSVHYYEKSLARDPNNAKAWSGLAVAYSSLGLGYWNYRPMDAYPKAKEALKKALALDSRMAEAHTHLGFLRCWFEYDWEGAEEALKQAIRLNPNLANAYDWYGVLLKLLGRFDGALEAHRRACELDPLSVLLLANWALALYRARRYEEAIQKWQEIRELYPQNPMPPYLMSLAEVQIGHFESAVNHVEEAKKLSGAATTYHILIPYIYAFAGKRKVAYRLLRVLEDRKDNEHLWITGLAMGYAQLGENERALQLLKQAYEERNGWIIYLAVEPGFDKLREEPKFIALKRKMGLG